MYSRSGTLDQFAMNGYDTHRTSPGYSPANVNGETMEYDGMDVQPSDLDNEAAHWYPDGPSMVFDYGLNRWTRMSVEINTPCWDSSSGSDPIIMDQTIRYPHCDTRDDAKNTSFVSAPKGPLACPFYKGNTGVHANCIKIQRKNLSGIK